MQLTIKASFDSLDEADRAVSRLRRSIPRCKADVHVIRSGESQGNAPFHATAYYPWRINMTVNESGTMTPMLGSRVLYAADPSGPPYASQKSAEVIVSLDPQDAERARGMLLNQGGREFQILSAL